jgi:hypothetical protein
VIGNFLRRSERRLIESYALSARDLAIYRMLYAAFVLVAVVPVAVWIPSAPRAFFNPPIGPAALFTNVPPSGVILGLNLLLTLFAALLFVGWRTTLASVGTGLTLLALDSWRYSLGKIDHDILLVVAPLVLGFAGWGRALSVDATRRSTTDTSEARGTEAEAWPVALFALLVGFALFTSGWAKATTGWLNPDLKCTYGHLATNYLVTGRETWAAKLALPIQSDWFWKGADWATVALELAVLPAALRRRSFCLVLALVTIFHVGVMLLFDIPFRVNVIAYGAFVRYTDLPLLASLGARPLSRKGALAAFVAACACGLTGTLLGSGLVGNSLDEVIVGIGGLMGIVYLLRTWVRWCGGFLSDRLPTSGRLAALTVLESRATQSPRANPNGLTIGGDAPRG